MPVTSVSKPGPVRSATNSPAGPHAPALATAQSAQPAEDLAAIDNELARQAEQTLTQDLADAQFDLEGDFLSQEEIAKVMAAEEAGGGNSPADTLNAAPTGGAAGAESIERQSAEPAGDFAAATELAGERSEISDSQSETLAAVEAPAPAIDQQIEAAVEPAGPANAAVIAAQAADAISLADAQNLAQESADAQSSEPVAESPALAASDPAVAASTSAEGSAGGNASVEPVALADGAAAAAKAQSAGSVAPAAESAKPATPTEAKATPSASPEAASEVAAESGEDSGAMPRWQQMIVRVATLADIPFAGLPRLVKTILGIVGGAAFLAGVTMWVMGK